MAPSLDSLSPAQLQALIADAQSRVESVRIEHKRALKERILDLIKAEGFTYADVFGEPGVKPRSKRAGAGVPKFRNPADPAQTWTGFGKKPAWFVDALKRPGVTPAHLAIEGAPVNVTVKTPAGKKATAKAAKSAAPAKKVAVKKAAPVKVAKAAAKKRSAKR